MNYQNKNLQFAVCINNKDYEDDLKVMTIYATLEDESAAKSNYLRVIDETGEDYLYPADLFIQIDIPKKTKEVLLQAFSETSAA